MRPHAPSLDQHRPSDRTQAAAAASCGTGNRRGASPLPPRAPSPPGRLWKPSGDKQWARAALAICCCVPGFRGRLLNLFHASGLSDIAQPFPAARTERPKFRCCFYCVPTPPPPRSKRALGCVDGPAGAAWWSLAGTRAQALLQHVHRHVPSLSQKELALMPHVKIRILFLCSQRPLCKL